MRSDRHMRRFAANILLVTGLVLGSFVWAMAGEAPPKAPEKKGGRPEEAQKLFVEALQLAQDAEGAKEKNLMGEYERMSKLVVADYEKALKLCPGDGEMLISYGAFFFNTGQFEKALAQYELAIAAFKKIENKEPLAEALFNKASTLYTQQKFAEALIVAEEVLALDPKHAEALEVKASCVENLKSKKP